MYLTLPSCAHGYTLTSTLLLFFFLCLEHEESPSERRKWTKDWKPDNALIKSHFNIPPLQRRALREGTGSGDGTG